MSTSILIVSAVCILWLLCGPDTVAGCTDGEDFATSVDRLMVCSLDENICLKQYPFRVQCSSQQRVAICTRETGPVTCDTKDGVVYRTSAKALYLGFNTSNNEPFTDCLLVSNNVYRIHCHFIIENQGHVDCLSVVGTTSLQTDRKEISSSASTSSSLTSASHRSTEVQGHSPCQVSVTFGLLNDLSIALICITIFLCLPLVIIITLRLRARKCVENQEERGGSIYYSKHKICIPCTVFCGIVCTTVSATKAVIKDRLPNIHPKDHNPAEVRQPKVPNSGIEDGCDNSQALLTSNPTSQAKGHYPEHL